MKTTLTLTALTLTALGMATPAFAGNDSPFADGADAAHHRSLSASDVCLQEIAAVPLLGVVVGEPSDTCPDGNAVDHG
jgi:hypothetical protein